MDLNMAPTPVTLDLGSIDEPLLVCGGAYSNLEALSAFLEIAEGEGISPDRIIHTGDVVAYGADPSATADLLRRSGVHAIQGNVEESLSRGHSECQCGFDEGSLCLELSSDWFAYADAGIGADLRSWMGGLPHQLTFTMAGRRVRVLHGGVRRINKFIYPSTPDDAVFEAEFEAADADVILAGHCSLPFTRHVGDKVWHNSGALGLPANDGTSRVWFARVTPDNGRIRFEHVPLVYDHETARNKMLLAGLPRGYADALASGLWPSTETLPASEQQQTGIRLGLAA